jgi:hypothetical protein
VTVMYRVKCAAQNADGLLSQVTAPTGVYPIKPSQDTR